MSIQTVVKSLTQTLSETNSDTSKAEVLLASAIAITFAVPAECNGATGRTFYNANYLETARRLINGVNEEFMIDVPTTLQLTSDIFTFRFNCVHCVKESLDAFQGFVSCAYKTVSENEHDCPEFSVSELKAVATAVCALADEQ